MIDRRTGIKVAQKYLKKMKNKKIANMHDIILNIIWIMFFVLMVITGILCVI